MNWRYTIFLLLLGLCAGRLGAQSTDPETIHVDTVMVFGNEKTRDEVILREIPFQFPADLTSDDLQLIQNRLYNLFLFRRLQMALQPLQDGRQALLVIVDELWYIYPVPLLFTNDREWDKLSYGFVVTHYNFRGRHERLTAGGWLGYDPGFILDYRNPWLGRNARLILEVGFFLRRIANKIEPFDEHHLGARIGIGRKFTLNFSGKLAVELRRIGLPAQAAHYSFSGTDRDLAPKASLELRYDTRDLYEFPSRGLLLDVILTRNGFTRRQANFWRLESDTRIYLPLHSRLTLAARNFGQFNHGPLPIYDRIYIGYAERIRGYFNRVMSDENLLLHNLELRYSLLPIHYFSVQDQKLLSSLTESLRFGISLSLFVDSGIVWNDASQLALKRYFTGYGVGLHIFLPYVQLLRLNYARNDRGGSEWILEGGVAF
ncbi:MAG: hypothetical protein D6715_07490 [Calditrichaeota bacterium]|nr:MAG: hypothetical protein D6715_07490 [Calditrichota bacterium]